MDITVYTHPVPFCLVKNFLSLDKSTQVKKELNDLRPDLKPAETTSPAKIDNKLAAKRLGIFLHEASYLRGNSAINSIFDIVVSKTFVTELCNRNWLFNYLRNKNYCGTLVSLYEDGDSYQYHKDKAMLSIIYYAFEGEFQGGDFFLQNVKVPIEDNSLIIFPSCVDHCVYPVNGPGSRWSVTTFFNIDEDIPRPPPDIFKFPSFTSPDEWTTIQKNMPNAPWILKGNSLGPDDNEKFWYTDLSKNDFFTKTLFERIPHGPWILERVYANGQSYGQNGKFHQDSTNPKCWTFILYTNEIDTVNINSWGGQTEFQTKIGTLSQVPEPNLGILFKSDIFHRGLGPSKKVDGLRITIAWKLIKA